MCVLYVILKKMLYYELEPEVAGELGANTVIDTKCHPPIVSVLHYEMNGWLGDCLLESFPCFIVKSEVADELEKLSFTGFSTSPFELTCSHSFDELQPDRKLGSWVWLKLDGIPKKSDLSLSESATLIASERALDIFKKHGLNHCDVESN